MENCPDCGIELVGPVIPEGEYPRYTACISCSYPLEYSKMLERIKNEKITEAVLGASFGPGHKILSGNEGMAFLKEYSDFSWPIFEDKTAVGFQIDNDILIFNFGAPGDYERYLSDR